MVSDVPDLDFPFKRKVLPGSTLNGVLLLDAECYCYCYVDENDVDINSSQAHPELTDWDAEGKRELATFPLGRLAVGLDSKWVSKLFRQQP